MRFSSQFETIVFVDGKPDESLIDKVDLDSELESSEEESETQEEEATAPEGSNPAICAI